MDPRLMLVFLWSSVAPDDVRLVGGASRCDGSLEQNREGTWDAVGDQFYSWNQTPAAAVCRRLDCGSLVSLRRTQSSAKGSHHSTCVGSRCFDSFAMGPPTSHLEITCSDSVRLVNGTSRCSGRLEVKSTGSGSRSWSSVCAAGFDQQGAEVVCRELGCGAPSVLQAALYGGAEAPMGTSEFWCGGSESALLDCGGSAGPSCSPGLAVGLTCAEPHELRLSEGSSRCSGILEMRHLDEWKPVHDRKWNLRSAGAVCKQLDCGSAVSTTEGKKSSNRLTWDVWPNCDAPSLVDCLNFATDSPAELQVTCSDSVRLVNGTHMCSGRLEVKSTGSGSRSWSSVCAAGFDQQGAEVVCRELGCGAPSVLQAALYGGAEAPMGTSEFWCGGSESALLDCGGSAGPSCSPGLAVGLTCTDPDDVRLVGGANGCTGGLELRHGGRWDSVDVLDSTWTLQVASLMCLWLDCGAAVSSGQRRRSEVAVAGWRLNTSCVHDKATLKECVTAGNTVSRLSVFITCSDSVRLVNGTSRCSGRLEVKSTGSGSRSWSSVCAAGFDQQGAEVVCRELGCGAPSVLQAALYGGAEAPMGTSEFWCGGSESALLDCSGSAGPSCSPGLAVGLTCAAPEVLRLEGEPSRCAGRLQMRTASGWRPAAPSDNGWGLACASAACRLLGCGSAVSTVMTEGPEEVAVWWVDPACVRLAAALLPCALLDQDPLDQDLLTHVGLELVCSDLLAEPAASLTASYRVFRSKTQGLQVILGSSFSISCSIEPQFPGGAFELHFLSADTPSVRVAPAANHSAHFLFPAAGPAHRGTYSCLYRVHVFSQNFSSSSAPLHLSVSASVTELMIRLIVLLVGVASLALAAGAVVRHTGAGLAVR